MSTDQSMGINDGKGASVTEPPVSPSPKAAPTPGGVTAPGVSYGLVEFRHLHVAMRALAFMLAHNRVLVRPSPFDEERAASLEAIRTALAHPVRP